MRFALISKNMDTSENGNGTCSGATNSLVISENVHVGLFHMLLEVSHDITLDRILGEQDTYLTI